MSWALSGSAQFMDMVARNSLFMRLASDAQVVDSSWFCAGLLLPLPFDRDAARSEAGFQSA